jgi:hypothetical protein
MSVGTKNKFTVSAALATALISGVFTSYAQSAKAETVTEDFSGTFGTGADSFNYSGSMTLDVVGGQADSGTGTISILGLSDVPMVLITTNTPGNETSPGPVGYRGNDGTDFGGLDTVIPIDTIGLLFDVDTTTAAFGKFPLINLAFGTNDSVFTGKVSGTEHYDVVGSTLFSNESVAATPLPSTWTMLIAGFIGLGYFAYRGKKDRSVSLSAA